MLPVLHIANKNYSSWSLRPWIAMKVLGLEFQELRIPLYGPASSAEIRRYSPTGKVPCLKDEGVHRGQGAGDHCRCASRLDRFRTAADGRDIFKAKDTRGMRNESDFFSY